MPRPGVLDSRGHLYLKHVQQKHEVKDVETHLGSALCAAKYTCKKGWSVRFFPRLGRLTSGLIPTDCSSCASPIPEWKSICGEPIVPAERITSLVA